MSDLNPKSVVAGAEMFLSELYILLVAFHLSRDIDYIQEGVIYQVVKRVVEGKKRGKPLHCSPLEAQEFKEFKHEVDTAVAKGWLTEKKAEKVLDAYHEATTNPDDGVRCVISGGDVLEVKG